MRSMRLEKSGPCSAWRVSRNSKSHDRSKKDHMAAHAAKEFQATKLSAFARALASGRVTGSARNDLQMLRLVAQRGGAFTGSARREALTQRAWRHLNEDNEANGPLKQAEAMNIFRFSGDMLHLTSIMPSGRHLKWHRC